MTRATILIPAHNEAAVIGRTLLHLSRGLEPDEFRIVVIANACSDSTSAKVRAVLPSAMVIETSRAGKCNALNLGYREAEKDKPIICLDADLDVTAESVRALIAPLDDGSAEAACGKMDVRTNEAPPLVRAYYKGWRTNPYFDRGKFGGVFALSPAAVSRVFPLPELIADDEFVRRSISQSATAFVPDCHFTARAPATVASLIAVRRRCLRGAREITAIGLQNPEQGSLRKVLSRFLRRPSAAFPIIVYCVLNAWVHLTLKYGPQRIHDRWERDLTTRTAG
jgi:glycosyltransferase involved in cell wall biosynthesis